METRCYFRRSSVLNRLVSKGLLDASDDKLGKDRINDPLNYGHYGCHRFEDDLRLVYVVLHSTVEPVPSAFRGLQIVEAVLHDKLYLEQNPHVKQGRGKIGKSVGEVSFRKEKFISAVGSDMYMSTEVEDVRDYAEVWVRGPNLESVYDAFNKIRDGKSPHNWESAGSE